MTRELEHERDELRVQLDAARRELAVTHGHLLKSEVDRDIAEDLMESAERQLGEAQQERDEIAHSAWQVLGTLWGINANAEQARIMNWFYAHARGQVPEEPLFPLTLDNVAAQQTREGSEP